ncbi:M50 family metallopeptidase [Arachnia propionica]|uniref:Metalloprotease mmpA n=2 Tax=Arachnia propionica TaxID=1750 RepID=A0A448MXC2_9ACTN|nr:site-2 protease family protein [Arachnia propionica]AFN47213.1 peptidase, M50 family [Arachnia propionica F0230a]VEH69786.1 Metalloprotease mmpA [Arachnia propionica]
MNTLVLIGLALLFFALIMVSIALHEIGHLVPAKIFGVKVTQYFVGFGRTIWSRKRGETEYGFKLFPLGGYVRLVGMYPPEKQSDKPKGWLTRLADRARSYEYEEITPADDGRLFHQKPVWQKVIVMLGGPAMNLLLAFLIFLGINLFHGTWQLTLNVTVVNDCVIPAGRTPATCQDGDPQTPAKQAGVMVGDKVVAFNGHRVSTWDELTDLIRANRDGAATLTVERDGRTMELPTVNTIIQSVPDRLDPTSRVEAGFLGVSPSRELVRGGVIETAGQMWNITRMSLVALASFPVRVWNVGVGLATGAERDINSPISVVGASRVAGEIAVADSVPIQDRVASWLSLLGSVNLFVALLNLVPLLPLDGGHIAGALYEALRRGLARLRGKSDPGPVDTAKMLPVAYLVGGFLLIGGVVLILADIISPIKLF